MATWLCHLRVADEVLKKFDLPRREFLAGNIAPDCGLPDGNGGFDPPKEITHLTSGSKSKCDYRRFAEETLPTARNEAERAFLLGYFSHLVADVVWTQVINEPEKARFRDEYTADREGYYRRVKAEWYGNDLLFLEAHPNYAPLEELKNAAGIDSSVLPYYGKDNVTVQIRNICAAYSGSYGGGFKYLDRGDVDVFVEKASERICEELAKQGVKTRNCG